MAKITQENLCEKQPSLKKIACSFVRSLSAMPAILQNKWIVPYYLGGCHMCLLNNLGLFISSLALKLNTMLNSLLESFINIHFPIEAHRKCGSLFKKTQTVNTWKLRVNYSNANVNVRGMQEVEIYYSWSNVDYRTSICITKVFDIFGDPGRVNRDVTKKSRVNKLALRGWSVGLRVALNTSK